MRSICSVSDCGSFVLARGLCNRHYSAAKVSGRLADHPRRYGRGLKWLRELVDYDGDDCIEWPWARERAGYGRVWFEGKIWVTSRLICTWVHGEPPTPRHYAAHSCGRGRFGCVTPGHLRWATPTENSQDKFIHGTQPLGDRHWARRRRKARQLRGVLRSILIDRMLSDPRLGM